MGVSDASAGLLALFLGRPRPGPGRLVMGFRVGSMTRGKPPGATPALAAVLCWVRLRPWKCCLGGLG